MQRLARLVFVVIAGAVPGCTNAQLVQLPPLEQATSVKLIDRGEHMSSEDDDVVVVLDESQRIKQISDFLKTHSDNWHSVMGTPRATRYSLHFEQPGAVPDILWLDRDYLAARWAKGDWRFRNLTQAESAELLGIFQFTSSFKSK